MGERVVIPIPAALSALRDGSVPGRLADRVFVLESPGRRGLWCTTKGLGDLGLPELQTRDVPFPLAEAWAHALIGIALRVLEHCIEAVRAGAAGCVELPVAIVVTAGDVARAYGEPDHGGGRSATVRVRLVPAPSSGSDAFLTVAPGDGASGSARGLTKVCTDLFGPVDVPTRPRGGNPRRRRRERRSTR